ERPRVPWMFEIVSRIWCCSIVLVVVCNRSQFAHDQSLQWFTELTEPAQDRNGAHVRFPKRPSDFDHPGKRNDLRTNQLPSFSWQQGACVALVPQSPFDATKHVMALNEVRNHGVLICARLGT